MTERTVNKELLGFYLLACIGIALLLPGAYFLTRATMQVLAWQPATGIVADIHYRRAVASGGAEMGYPVVTFRTLAGQEIRIQGLRGYSRVPFATGDTVAVRYDPANPRQAYIVTFFEIFGPGALMTGFGLAFLFGAWLAHPRMT